MFFTCNTIKLVKGLGNAKGKSVGKYFRCRHTLCNHAKEEHEELAHELV